VADLAARAQRLPGEAMAMESMPGAGSVPGVTLESFGVVIAGDHLAALRAAPTPVIARVRDQRTWIDLRTVDPGDDEALAAALAPIAG
jgi:L-seryl-tRNA(Ser) seleniumtransferase